MSERELTYCRICEAACGLVGVRDARGELVDLQPDREHPTSAGFACAKGTRFLEVARHPTRLLSPMLREGRGGALRPVSWDQALSDAGARLADVVRRHGPHAVAVYYGNPIAFNTLGAAGMLGFVRALGTRNVYGAGSQDCANKFAGAELVHGSVAIHPIPDLERCELAVFFGTNPAVSQTSFFHLEGGTPMLKKILARGGEIVWLDPRKTESARMGTHLAIRPGTDVFLLLALLGLLGEGAKDDERTDGLEALLAVARGWTPERAATVTGLAATEIRALAARIAGARGVVLHMGVGVNQGGFGTLAYVALHALAFVTGNLDREGGLLFHPLAVGGARLLRSLGLGRATAPSRVGDFLPVADALPGAILADEILTPGDEQVRALVVIAGDPLRSIPGEPRLRRALESLEVLVSIDLFENATGRLADLILPTTSWLERWDVATTTIALQQSGLVQAAGPLEAPPGETRGEARILAELALAMGRGGLTASWLARLARLPWDRWLPTALGLGGRAGRYGFPSVRPTPGRYLGRGPQTPGHRLRFWSASLADELARLDEAAAQAARVGADTKTFLLIGRRRKLGHNGWLHGGARGDDPRTQENDHAAWLAPADATALGLTDGDSVELRTRAGKLALPVFAREGVLVGTVVVPHGLPDLNVNAIIPSGAEAVERISGQHRMTGIPVELRRGPGPAPQ